MALSREGIVSGSFSWRRAGRLVKITAKDTLSDTTIKDLAVMDILGCATDDGIRIIMAGAFHLQLPRRHVVTKCDAHLPIVRFSADVSCNGRPTPFTRQCLPYFWVDDPTSSKPTAGNWLACPIPDYHVVNNLLTLFAFPRIVR